MHDMTRYERELQSIDPERAERERQSRELAWSNRRLIADRLHWPVGVLQECEWLDRDHPGWSAWWQAAGASGPARLTATRHGQSEPKLSGATAHELAEAIEAAPEEQPVIRHLDPLI